MVSGPNCYKCVHRRSVPGDAHSACANPSTGTSGDMFDGLVALLDVLSLGYILQRVETDQVG